VKVGDAILLDITKGLADLIGICHSAILIDTRKPRVGFLMPNLKPSIWAKIYLGSVGLYESMDIAAICQLYND
jgi:hypothetical protein